MALDVIKQIYQHLGAGDLDSIVALCDEQVEWVVNGASSIEVTGAFQGIEGVRSFLASVDKAWMLRFSAPREFIDAGDKVVVLGEGAGKQRATGESFQNRWVHVFTMRNGRIVSFRLFVCQWLGDDTPPAMSWQ
jgi:ketosteroid isomerase-like protein